MPDFLDYFLANFSLIFKDDRKHCERELKFSQSVGWAPFSLTFDIATVDAAVLFGHVHLGKSYLS